jgi:hypothetical protein
MGPASGSAGKKPENHVHRFARLAAQPLSGVGRVTVQAVYPDRPQASLAEDSPSFSFCLADCRGRCLPDVVNQYRNWETGVLSHVCEKRSQHGELLLVLCDLVTRCEVVFLTFYSC